MSELVKAGSASVYGAALLWPILLPLRKNSTSVTPTLSVAAAVSVTLWPTSALAEEMASDTLGGVLSGATTGMFTVTLMPGPAGGAGVGIEAMLPFLSIAIATISISPFSALVMGQLTVCVAGLGGENCGLKWVSPGTETK